jgi:alkylation response protein AidB-like acyl-CoA dehydrogenase
MDVEATPEQLMLRDATRSFLESRSPLERVRELAASPAGIDRDAWAEAASMGLHGLLVAESLGGSDPATADGGGDGLIAAAIVAEQFGRLLHPGPFVPHTVVADALARAGSARQQADVLPALLDGSAMATWAIADGPGSWDAAGLRTTATRVGDGYVVTGTKRWVQDAHIADHLFVTCRGDDGPVQLLVPGDAIGVTVTPLESLDLGRRLADVTFAGVEVGADAVVGDADRTPAQLDRQLRVAVVLQCAETVGAAAHVIDKAVAYARERIAFGRPIGSFQAVKHMLAESYTWLEASEAATWAAARAIAADAADAARATHVAKIFVARHCPTIVEQCMQVHGGIAMTWEDDCHLYLRRVQSNRMLHGSPAWHADRLCTVVGVGAGVAA